MCEEAKCPNIGECWGGGKHETATATIMVWSSQTQEMSFWLYLSKCEISVAACHDILFQGTLSVKLLVK